MMRSLCFMVLAMLIQISSYAQLQLGIFGGVANYHGDIVDKLYQSPKPAIGLTFGYQINSRINVRAGLTFAKVAGADSLSSQQDLKLRNLNFQSPVSEFSVVGEFNTFDLDVKRWTPYIFAGVAFFRFNPYTLDRNGNKVFLQPLGTEGQGLAGYPQSDLYGLTQFAIPFGGGIKFNLSEKFRLGLEVGLRKTFTDYLDDVSGNYADLNDLLLQRGDRSADLAYRGDEIPGGDPIYPEKGATRGSAKYKDYYYFSGLHLTYLLGEGGGTGGRAAKKKGYGCPTVF
jgi:hypothetical protein